MLKAAAESNLTIRGSNEIEKPHGEWNAVEIIADGARLKVSVKGKVMFEGTHAQPDKGRILIECAYAEMWWRKFELHPLSKR